MRKITLSLFAVLFTVNMFAVDKLLIVGPGVDIGFNEFAGWDGNIAPLMYAEGNDVFTFTGYFPADADFKFMQNKDWGGQYLNAALSEEGTGYLDLTTGGTLREGGADTKFKMKTAGFYKITCNLNALTVTAEATDGYNGQPIRFQGYYMVGDATLGNWELEKSIPLEYQGGSEYSITTWLKVGTFKLTVAPHTGWVNKYFFFKDASDDSKMKRNQGGDLKWSVTEEGLYTEGLYTITINIADNSISYQKKDFNKLYVVGAAVDGGWITENIPMMNEVSSNVFTYTGWFKADEEFKFIAARALSSTGLQIHNGSGDTGYIVDGEEGLLPNIEANFDHKFKLDESANYTIVCNLNTMKITAEKAAYQTTQIKHAALYMVGTATPDKEVAADFPTKAVKLTSNGDNTYSVENVSLTTGVFKLLTANDLGWSTTNLFRDADDDTKISTDGDGDRKWTISSAGNYDITADLANMTISITLKVNEDTSIKSFSGASIDVAAGKSLTIEGNLENSGVITLHSDDNGTATLIVGGTIKNVGSTITEQYLDMHRSWYMSSPLNNATISGATKYFTFKEADDSWSEKTNTLSAGEAIMLNPNGSGIISFSGALQNEDVTLSSLSSAKKRFHYVGNPYTSYLDWSELTKSNLEASIWFRTVSNGQYAFATYNQVIGTPLETDNTIAPMQGFWVRVQEGQSGSIKFSKNDRKHFQTGMTKPLRTPQVNFPILRLEVNDGTLKDEAVIYFEDKNLNGKDNYDAAKMLNGNNIPEIWTLVNGEATVINAMQTIPYNVEMALGFNTKKADRFTLRASEFKGFSEGDKVLLIDKLNGNIVDISTTDYNFISDADNTNDRFAIKFTPGTTTGFQDATSGKVHVYTQNKNLMLSVSHELNNVRASVYSVNGQKIATQTIQNQTNTLLKNVNSGIYFVVIEIGAERLNKKIIVKE